jgi:GH15 family glucan-1,4-alpha-glucosidase
MTDDPLLNMSLDVIRDCVVANGAVVAANSDRPDYPHCVQSYRHVWPRDAAFMCVAAGRAGLRDFQEGFFRWLLHRAEGLRDSGLLFQNYDVNGPKRGLGLQIDQNGSILWALDDFFRGNYPADMRDLVRCLANGILSVWGKGFFSALTQDLWEERYTYPELEQFHSYSLAACVKGLRCAASLEGKYLECASEMEDALRKANRRGLVRTAGKLKDATCDASLLGLVWPSGIYEPHHPLVDRLIVDIERHLVRKGGIRRYENDYYDGHRKHGIDSRRGGGAWPILHFWLAIVLCLREEREKAKAVADGVLRRIPDRLLPEQIFNNDIQTSIKPLGWSHAMYVLYRTMALEPRSR